MKPFEFPITAQGIGSFIEIYNAIAGTNAPAPIEPIMPERQERGCVIFTAYDKDRTLGRWAIREDVGYAKYDSVLLWHEVIDISWFKVGMVFSVVKESPDAPKAFTVDTLVYISKIETAGDLIVLSTLDGSFTVEATPWDIFGFFAYVGKTLLVETKGKTDE